MGCRGGAALTYDRPCVLLQCEACSVTCVWAMLSFVEESAIVSDEFCPAARHDASLSPIYCDTNLLSAPAPSTKAAIGVPSRHLTNMPGLLLDSGPLADLQRRVAVVTLTVSEHLTIPCVVLRL